MVPTIILEDDGKGDVSELKHYGVKGMQWGVRKDRKSRAQGRMEAIRALRKMDREVSEESILGFLEIEKKYA